MINKLFLPLLLFLVPVGAFAAPVQCTSVTFCGITSTSCSADLPSTPTVGNHIIVTAINYETSTQVGIDSFSDNQGNTYAVDVTRHNIGSGSPTVTLTVTIGSAKIATASGTFTVSANASDGDAQEFAACEWSGLATTSWFDQSGTSNATSGTTNAVTASGANSQANMLVIAIQTNSDTSTPTTGYTNLYHSTNITTTASYKTVSASETSSATFTAGSTYVDDPAAIATYKLAAAAGTGHTSTRGIVRP